MKKFPAAAAALGLIILFAAAAACQSDTSGAATVAENKETIRTYPFSDPDPVPIFARSSIVQTWSRTP